MSLFKARERWTAAASHLGQDEEFDTGCMCVGNLDNDPSGDMKIATGSFQGVLRIFKPQEGEYGVEDLLYEQQYDDPILQLEAGQFSSNNPNTVMLAVLHSRKLVIYSTCLLYTSDAADEEDSVDLGGRRIIKKKKNTG
eukprot:TRINITY_DN18721_c0_g1_i2.p1 TRINITY_DN18721_c0_g1~~TRINITY_DN18721_c0_g1_i2.p1  ORF type:complete len:139 (+),score=40.42 TRINITY_DN18721_c0_g1_i2:79-495(+)